MKLGLLFPGQGFQKLGLLKPFANCREIPRLLEQIDAALPDLKLSKPLMDDSLDVDINQTSVAQPLILAASYAMYSVLKPQLDNHEVRIVMGHSLGEYSAFVAAGILDFSAALKLVRARGLAMQAAAPNTTGMTLVAQRRPIPEFEAKLGAIIAEHNIEIAGYNSAQNTVLTGTLDDLKLASADISKLGRVLCQPLNVSGAFHSRFMEPAQTQLAEIVATAPFSLVDSPKVVSNVTARPYTSLDEIRKACVDALTKPVLWKQSLHATVDEIDGFVSIGPGRIGSPTKAEYDKPTWYYENAEPFAAV